MNTHAAIDSIAGAPHLGRPVRVVRRIAVSIPPVAGAVVMGTGIISIAFALDGRETLSRALLAVAALGWVALGLVLVGRLISDPARTRREAHRPAELTAVADTAVLGTRLALLGWTWAAIPLLVIAVALWLALLEPVLAHLATPARGGALMVVVSTESLAVLAAALASVERLPWLLYAAIAPFLLGLGLYAFVIAHFDLRHLLAGRGDHWIAGGALAISALAGGRITLAAQHLGVLGGASSALEAVSLALWAVAIAWLPALLVAEIVRPRLRYDARRWSTVFPVGMYAACSFIVGRAAGSSALSAFASVWVWVGIPVWAAAFAGMARRGARLARGA